ncbi:MAG: methylenetetrahydrofolate reductase [NAD(P)H] [Lachnospiraceae bacterium]|nr:methylenetetrahydrofolate reductase [NAD(P)H] [Lachnospiraceae bacterium]
MKLSEIMQNGRTAFTFEIFPPKKDMPIDTIYNTLDGLKGLKPDFISVTYGAGGSAADTKTADIAQIIQEKYGIEAAVHLTCLYNSREDIDLICEQLKERNINNILALRGDFNPKASCEPKKDFLHASDLIAYLKTKGDFHIMGACYPEGHQEAVSLEADIDNLKRKVDAGATHLLSQLFFDNDAYFRFLEKARAAGITVPIEAGIMPCTSKASIERMVTMCGASLPAKFTRMMARYESYPEAIKEAGIAYAIDQVIDLISRGVDGIHLYTMNSPYVAKRISDAVAPILNPHLKGTD